MEITTYAALDESGFPDFRGPGRHETAPPAPMCGFKICTNVVVQVKYEMCTAQQYTRDTDH